MFAYFHPATSWAELARRTARETVHDGCFGLAAQLAFYFLLALFPALLVVASVLAHLPIHDALGQVLSRFDILAPQQAADLALTLRGLALGKRERNPLALFLMRHMGRVPGLVFLKLASLACFYLIAIRIDVFWQMAALAAASLLGLAVVVQNIRVLRRRRKA